MLSIRSSHPVKASSPKILLLTEFAVYVMTVAKAVAVGREDSREPRTQS